MFPKIHSKTHGYKHRDNQNSISPLQKMITEVQAVLFYSPLNIHCIYMWTEVDFGYLPLKNMLSVSRIQQQQKFVFSMCIYLRQHSLCECLSGSLCSPEPKWSRRCHYTSMSDCECTSHRFTWGSSCPGYSLSYVPWLCATSCRQNVTTCVREH